MASLFDRTHGKYNISEIFRQMETNCPVPKSNSQALWELRRKTHISHHNPSSETLLEKSVAMLAKNGHMPGWFNQCPTASGIGDSSRNRHSNVDLVQRDGATGTACLIELKWGSDSPCEAIQQILRYGASYLYCRRHRNRLPVDNRPIMDSRHIALKVVAPARYFENDTELQKCYSRARKGVDQISKTSLIPGLSMSIEVLALPANLVCLPFSTGSEVIESCDQDKLTKTGQQIRDSFNGLIPVCA